MKKYDHINFKPTDSMAKAAQRGLDMRDKQPDSNKGMTSVGLARARQLIAKETLSPETVKRMHSFFSRHEVDKSSDSWKKGDSKGEQAWLGWGGDAGQSWAAKVVKQIESADKDKKGNSMRLNRVDKLHVNQEVSKRRVRGKDMIVVHGAVHMIGDSVMNGIFYPMEETKNLCDRLEGKRVTMPASHPEDDAGNFMSANDPLALSSNFIGGWAENFSIKGDKLISDILIDPELARTRDAGNLVMDAIENGEDLDLSTGFYFQPEIKQGVGNDGEEYGRIATNLEMDHSAFLPYEPGSKQSNEGVGLHANSAIDKDGGEVDMVTFEANASAAGQNYPVADAGTKWDGAQAEKRIREFSKSGDKPSTNYRKFFMWFDRDNPEDYGSYKLPFVDVVDGRPQVIPKALAAIKGSLSGARGETVDITDADKKAVEALVASYENKASTASNSKLGIIERATNALKDALASLNGYNTDSGVDAAFNKSDEDQRMKKMMMEKLKKNGVDMAENASDDEVMNAYEKMMKGDKKKNEMDDDKGELEMKKKDAKGNSSNEAPAWFQSFEERFSSLESAVNSSKDQEKAPYIEAAKNCGISEADAKAMSIDSLRAVVANSGESVNFTGGTGEYAANSKPFSLDI